MDTEVGPAGTASTVTATFGAADLQPWLGMAGHMIVVGPVDGGPDTRVDDPRGVATAPVLAHVHAMLPPTPGFPDQPDESVAAFGPDVSFTYSFPLPGRYLAWIQAERDYSVVTVPLVVDVPPAKGAES